MNLLDRFLAWLQPLIFMPPMCREVWDTETPEPAGGIHACGKQLGHDGPCKCWCGVSRYATGGVIPLRGAKS